MEEQKEIWAKMQEHDSRLYVDFRDEFYHDAYVRELGEAVEDTYAQEDRLTLKKLEYRLKHLLNKEQLDVFIRFIDTFRVQLMRAEGNAYIKGYVMGVEAGKVLEKHEQER